VLLGIPVSFFILPTLMADTMMMTMPMGQAIHPAAVVYSARLTLLASASACGSG
jgi:hypothetical protein